MATRARWSGAGRLRARSTCSSTDLTKRYGRKRHAPLLITPGSRRRLYTRAQRATLPPPPSLSRREVLVAASPSASSSRGAAPARRRRRRPAARGSSAARRRAGTRARSSGRARRCRRDAEDEALRDARRVALVVLDDEPEREQPSTGRSSRAAGPAERGPRSVARSTRGRVGRAAQRLVDAQHAQEDRGRRAAASAPQRNATGSAR